MKKLNYFILFLGLCFGCNLAHANPIQYESLAQHNQKLIHDIELYGGLLHQHQDFFYKAFSYQGVEAGILINNQGIFGVFGGSFASPLNVEVDSKPVYINSSKTGVTVGRCYQSNKAIHTGWLVNAGYFDLKTNEVSFTAFEKPETGTVIRGMLLSPELFAEVNVTHWMKFRTGLAFSFYNFSNQKVIHKDDLQGVSVNFGFLFGNFSK